MPRRPPSTTPRREETDEELVARCRAELPHRTGAFERLARRHEALLFAVCRRILGDQHEAEEAVQDVLLRMFNALLRFEGRSSLRTWIYTIAANVSATRRALPPRLTPSAHAPSRAAGALRATDRSESKPAGPSRGTGRR